jgi:hypothetical protein
MWFVGRGDSSSKGTARRLAIVVVLMSYAAMLSGCAVLDGLRYNRELLALMPSASGFEWKYSGFSGYDHQMKIDAIERQVGTVRLTISGMVGDPSGGESKRDHSLRITYTVANGVWTQEKVEEAMLDSEFDRLEILRGPIRVGTTWTQTQVDKEGRRRTLESTIAEITEEPARTLVVYYRERGSEYFERRRIVEGVGVVGFEKLWMSPEGNFEIGYYLFESTLGPFVYEGTPR